MLYEFVRNLAGKYYEALTVPGQLRLFWTLPIYLVLATLWQYFSALKKEERSVRQAFAKAFPKEDFKAVTFRTDLFCAFASHLIARPLLGLIAKIIIAVTAAELGLSLAKQTFGEPGLHIVSLPWIIALQAFMLFLSDEFSQYVIHYMTHRIPVLWASHRTHHSAEALTPIMGGSRATVLPLPTDFLLTIPVDAVIKGVVMGATLYWTAPVIHPIALTIIAWIAVYATFLMWFGHSRCRILYGKLSYVFNAPVLHHIHHSAELHQRDKNFGNVLSVFDWIFGTLYIPKKDETWRLGLNDEELEGKNPHIRIQDFLFEPYRYAWRSLHRKPALPAEKVSKASFDY
jgi:sterol desaturase/sphingolipid hydroxylase (fatty acid hydroxylase superfamily)